MALPPCSNETDTALPPQYAICARRCTSAIFCKIEAEHWPTSNYRPSSGICEPAVVPGRREEAVITTLRSASSATATISCRSEFVDAARSRSFEVPTRRSSSTSDGGCRSIGVPQNPQSDNIRVVQQSCFWHLAMIPCVGMRRACAPIFWSAPRDAASAPLKSWLRAYGLSCGILASMANAEPIWIRPCRRSPVGAWPICRNI